MYARILPILGALIVLLSLAACAPSQGSGTTADDEIDGLVDVGTHRLHLRCTGSGGPAVVIDTGVGDHAARWHAIQDRLAEEMRVCTYDRAGYGASEPGPMPRHGERVAGELERLLDAAGVEGPYVLVGHSLGGLHALLYAHRYPDQVAGLVLLDPPPLDFVTGQAFPELYQMAAQAPAQFAAMAEQARRSTDPQKKAQADYLQAVASEHAMFLTETAAQVAAIDSLGDVPLTVVAAGRPNPGFGEQADAFQRFWIEQNRALADRSSQGAFVLVKESGHHLEEDAPEAVLRAIRELVAAIE